MLSYTMRNPSGAEVEIFSSMEDESGQAFLDLCTESLMMFDFFPSLPPHRKRADKAKKTQRKRQKLARCKNRKK